MPKSIIYVFVLCFGVLSVGTIQNIQAVAGYNSYWDFYRSYHSADNPRTSSYRNFSPRYRSTNRSFQNSTRSSRPTSSRRMSNYRIYSTNRSSTSTATQSGVTATVTPVQLRQDINDVTDRPVDLFTIGLRNAGGSSSSFTPAVMVTQMQFEITDNTGVVSDFSNFDLVIEDQSFEFERNGFITLKFNNLRLARNESRSLDIKIRLNDPDNFARLPGSFRVKMTGLQAQAEGSLSAISTKVTGRTVSDYVVLNPSPSVSGGASDGQAGVTPVFVSGKALGAGDRAVVLSAILKASLDDFLLEKVTVRNAFGDNVDSLIQEVRLINQSSGKLLSTKRFTGGVAEFKLSRNNQVFISRNSEVNLVVEVIVRDNLPVSISDNRLELTFNDSDIEIFGVGSGRSVPDSRKDFNLNTETFTVTEGSSGATAVGGISFSVSQPSFVTTGNLEQIARFQIRNAGTKGMSVGRISIQAFPGGVEFTGGISVDDAQIVRVVNGFQEFASGFNTTSASGNTFVFDTNSELYIGPGSTQEFALKLKLDNTGAFDGSDSVAVKILGDSSFNKGTLSSVRSSGANYIWSDLSASPHSTNSSDWFSGFLVNGLPTGNFIRYRR